MIVVCFPFYYIILEEFYVGKMSQPAFTGPDDASLGIYALCLFTAYKGSEEFWKTEYDFFAIGEVRTSHLFLYALAIIELITLSQAFYTNLKQAKDTEIFKRRYQLSTFIRHVSFLPVASAVWMAYIFAPNSVAIADHTKLVTFGFGAHFLQGVMRLMLNNVTEGDF